LPNAQEISRLVNRGLLLHIRVHVSVEYDQENHLTKLILKGFFDPGITLVIIMNHRINVPSEY